MGFQLSPGVQIQEVDLTTIIPQVSTTVGAFAGYFNWGPCNTRILIGNPQQLVTTVQPPDGNTAVFYFCASNFLAYGNNEYIVRANGAGMYNATANGSPNVMIPNKDSYFYNNINGNAQQYGQWFARYPGKLGNSITVSECPSGQAFASNLTSLYAITAIANLGSTLIQCSATVSANVIVGDLIQVGSPQGVSNGFVSVTAVAGANLTVATGAVSANGGGLTITRKWQYASQFQGAPGTSTYANNKSGANDQLHIIVVDSNAAFYGSTSSGYILEKYPFLSKASDAKNADSSPAYYPTVLFNQSKFIYWADFPSTVTNWGNTAQGTTFSSLIVPSTTTLSGGADLTTPYAVSNAGYSDVNDPGLITAYGYYQSADDVDISLVPAGPASITVQQWIIDNIVNSRLDCVAFISPRYVDVVNQNNSEATNIVNNYLPLLGRSTTYAVCDSGWKYQFDPFNNIYRYIPLNPDIAGLCVYTDTVRDPWWSPAGYNRGFIKNVTKLAWNPRNISNPAMGSSNAFRDLLYTNGVNPVVNFKDVGPILFGDSTLTIQPSAFNRINVRRLFIVMEKAIATAAKYSLFEFNDAFTQAAFVNMVEPYLRTIKGRRGIYDFKVVCDSTNNTPAVIDADQFIGDIYIKPNRAINFITLHFVAVGTGVTFTEIVGTID